jgi:hypothetical protein
MPTDDERRRYPRYALELPVTLVLASIPGTTFIAKMKDLSAGGCFFRASLTRDDFDNVALSFRRGLRAPSAAGRVVRRISGQGFAVQFDEPSSDLQRLVSAVGALSAPLRAEFVSGFLDADVELSAAD